MKNLGVINTEPVPALSHLVEQTQDRSITLRHPCGLESIVVNAHHYRLLQSIDAAYWEIVEQNHQANQAFKRE